MTPASAHYQRSLRWFHWTMFLLILAAYVFGKGHEFFPRGSDGRGDMLGAHFLVGIAVFLLVWPRLWQRRKYGVPPIEPPLAIWTHRLAAATHAALYAFFIVQPLLGFFTAQLTGKHIGLFGVTVIPQWLTIDKPFGHQLEDIHVAIAEIFVFVILLHIAAALWHHYVVRDNVLKRMLPPAGNAG